MKPQTFKTLVLALIISGSAVGMAVVPAPGNFGFAFLLGLLGLELIKLMQSDS